MITSVDLDKRVPSTEWDVVDVTFGNADTDLEIQHTLNVPDPEGIDVQVIDASGPPLIYRDTSSTRTAWRSGVIILRSAVANLKARLLLTVPQEERSLIEGGGKLISGSLLDVQGIPTGMILPYGGSSAPSGYLLCDGAAVSRTTYATLFGVIGTAFGVGDGSTTFNLPDLKGRSPLGAGTGSGLTARTLGTKLGAETHILSASEMPVHNHGVNDPGHSHSVSDPKHVHIYRYGSGFGGGTAGYQLFNSGADNDFLAATGIALFASTTGITIANAGSGGAHNNMHPSTVVNFVIKT